MKLPIYSIRDVHTGFMTPTVDQNDASAMRNFGHAVMQSQSLMNSHPKDYSLYKVGEFDSDTGEISGHIPELVTDAFSLL